MLASTLAITYSNSSQSGHGSVGRAQPCQGWGRGFEPRCPLHCLLEGRFLFRPFAYRRSGQVVRQRPAKPLPPVRIRASPPELFRASIWAPFLVCTRAVGGTLTCPELAAPRYPRAVKTPPPLVPALELSAGMASRAGGPLRSGMIRYMYYFEPLFGSKVVPGNT